MFKIFVFFLDRFQAILFDALTSGYPVGDQEKHGGSFFNCLGRRFYCVFQDLKCFREGSDKSCTTWFNTEQTHQKFMNSKNDHDNVNSNDNGSDNDNDNDNSNDNDYSNDNDNDIDNDDDYSNDNGNDNDNGNGNDDNNDYINENGSGSDNDYSNDSDNDNDDNSKNMFLFFFIFLS